MAPRYALTGKTIRNRLTFTAQTQAEFTITTGGKWKTGEYAVRAQPLARLLDAIVITAVDETLYTVTIDGKAYTFTSGVAATATQIRDGLAAAIALGAPGNGVTTTNIAAGTLGILGRPGEFHTTAVGANLALTPGFETVPQSTVFQQGPRVIVRTASAFTGAFDVIAVG